MNECSLYPLQETCQTKFLAWKRAPRHSVEVVLLLRSSFIGYDDLDLPTSSVVAPVKKGCLRSASEKAASPFPTFTHLRDNRARSPSSKGAREK
ncbi:MAG TPA: hypothetical protein VFQ47_01990 [Nitrososphaera sp.]|nr:hypothetical protein [Nitrososphaera sp.]